jgi:hypothetical protein
MVQDIIFVLLLGENVKINDKIKANQALHRTRDNAVCD